MATLTAEPLTRETQIAPKPTPKPAAETWQPARRLFTVDEYYALYEHGIIDDDERTELIEGEIYVMTPPGPIHQSDVNVGNVLFHPLIASRTAIIQVQGAIVLGDNGHPEPDIALLKWRDDFYRDALPGPEDVLLIIETSDSSLSKDRNVKLPTYARHRIPEVWIENIPDHVLEAYRNPVNGEYTETRIYRPGETISPQAFPDLQLSVSQLIGPAGG